MDSIPDRLAAALADRYRLDSQLGAGGMATVYLAEDLKHHRRVAIKVLRPDLAAAVGPERFQDEVEIAAQLHHPHIVPVYDSGEAEGFLYYVMPLVEGKSLRERLQEGTPMPVPDVVRVLAEVADALAHAHDRGLVHRDIKPENIMFSGRHALVMDFGIAKAVRDAGARRSSTSLGLAMGTPEYMSPEQASGDPNLDHRADIYSLGVVGYELLTGKPPFSGGGTEQILTRHITQPPEPIANLRPDVPAAVAQIIARALAKSPDARWQSADALRSQLEPMMSSTTSGQVAATRVVGTARRPAPWRWAAAGGVVALGLAAWFVWGPSPSPNGERPADAGPGLATAPAAPAASQPPAIPDLATDPSIAVLPFQNMSSDPEQAYFSDGISEELLNLLAKIPELRVVARTSSFMYRDGKASIPEIGKALKVATVLEGSVRKNGDKVRITAQLIRASDGTHLWSQTYDRTLDDVFKVQDEIASNVVERLKLTLLNGAPRLRLVDPQVYPLVLRAESLLHKNSKAGRAEAISIYKDVLAQSPKEARAYSGLAAAYVNQLQFQELPASVAKKMARDAATKALELDPQLAVAHTFLGRLHMEDKDLPAAAASFEQALAIGPNSLPVLANSAVLLTRLGRLDEVAQIRRRNLRIDPSRPSAHIAACGVEAMLGNHQAALDHCRTALAMAPDSPYIHTSMAQLQLLMGRPAEALKQIEKEPDESSKLVVQAEALWALGRKSESDARIQELIADFADSYPFGVAEVYAYRGDSDRAFEWLERARATGDPELAFLHNSQIFEPMHKDPRWLPFLRSIGSAPEQLSSIKFNVKLPD